MTNEDNNRDTKYTNNDTNNHNAHDLHKWAQQRAVSCVSCLTDDVSHHIGSIRSRVCHLTYTPWKCAFLSDLFDLPFYFDLSFPVFFHSSVLIHPDLHTDLDNPDSVENNLRHSAKGRNDAYDATTSLTGYEPNDTVSNELVDSQSPFSYVTPSSDQGIDDETLGKLPTEAHREYADYRSLEGVFVCRVR